MDMGALGRTSVTRMVRVDAATRDEALALATAEHGPRINRVTLMRQFTVKVASKRDKRKRYEYVVQAANAHDAVRNARHVPSVWRDTGRSLVSTKDWPEAVLLVSDTTLERELGGAQRLEPVTGVELYEQEQAAIAAAASRWRRRRGRRS